MTKLGAKELRKTDPSSEEIKAIKRHPIYIVLDNVLDTYNIGSIFRLADAVAAEKVYLCGETEYPPNHRIEKASIGTWRWVPWEHCDSATEAIKNLRSNIKDLQVVAVEQNSKSIRFDQYDYQLPICIVVGHETEGVSKEVLEMADAIVELPMFGINKSLNVMVSAGIILYKIAEKI
ncbi:TrmH family RNA methyltransferase [Candidatus Microgenomates bacterium]|nr:TrmH family RNA methyltransferase [Candidatus Microgenomates bacterium]